MTKQQKEMVEKAYPREEGFIPMLHGCVTIQVEESIFEAYFCAALAEKVRPVLKTGRLLK